MQSDQPDLTISIISANNLDQLRDCLGSIYAQTHQISFEIFVVDNHSDDRSAEIVRAEYPDVCVIQNEIKQGFATNNNKILAQGNGRYSLLLNDDTIVQSGALDYMVAFADNHREVGIVGGFLLNPDLSFQPSFSSLPNPWIEGFWPTWAWFPRLKANKMHPFSTGMVCGAALMIRRETMFEIGLLDTLFDPIYAEETDWCFRAKKAGWQVYSHPQARIVHYGSQTMNRAPLQKIELLQRHKGLYFRKHFGKEAELFFKSALWLTSLLKSGVYSLLRWRADAKDKRSQSWHLVRKIFR